ncbi:MAG TPA: MlaD family protein [Solirubrobacteraceae bacterium]|nr:MlaD family protein [Solirubrobacteraceae bacterium]
MQKLVPSFRQLAVMVLFALSCFGLLLYLWLSFGGPAPLKPKGYRFTVLFPQAAQLSSQADVRISGVPVGRVISVGLGPHNTSKAVLELQTRYAPLHADARAALRQKTLLGETYVELTPGTRAAPAIREGGQLPAGRVTPMVALDEIFRSFDAPTRKALRTWMQAMAAGFTGRGQDISDAFGNLVPFTEDTGALASILHVQSADVRRLVRGTGTVFGALSQRGDQLRALIRGADATFSATNASGAALADAFRVLPRFERTSRAALTQLDALAGQASPVLDRLRPAISQLGPTFAELHVVAPGLESTLSGLDALSRTSRAGFPALVRAVGTLRTLLGSLSPSLRQLNPLLRYFGPYDREAEAFFSNFAAAAQGSNKDTKGNDVHFVRVETPVVPLSLAAFPARPGSGRANAYPKAGALGQIGALQVFDSSNCAAGDPAIAGDASAPTSPAIETLLEQLGVAHRAGGAIAAPPCTAQGPSASGTQFPHVTADDR